MTLEFSRQFPKNTQISNFMNIGHPVAAELLQADGWTGRDNGANSRFLPFCERA
jgi:hypothetical protein